jgi:hypothetical protein
MSRGMGGHELPNEGAEKIWLTPPAVLHCLGKFDLDPCAVAVPRPWATAKTMIAPPQDGLAAEWLGRVFCNPPYDADIALWLEKCALHRNVIALIFARTETDAWHRWVWPHADSILFLRGRLRFYLPDGTLATGSNSGAPSVLISYDRGNTWKLENSGIAGTLVKPGEATPMAGRRATQLCLMNA